MDLIFFFPTKSLGADCKMQVKDLKLFCLIYLHVRGRSLLQYALSGHFMRYTWTI